VKCELLFDVNMCSSLNFTQRPVLVVDATTRAYICSLCLYRTDQQRISRTAL